MFRVSRLLSSRKIFFSVAILGWTHVSFAIYCPNDTDAAGYCFLVYYSDLLPGFLFISTLLCYISLWNIDDNHRNPNNNDRDHLVGQLTNESVDNDFTTCVLNLCNDFSEFLLWGWIKLNWQWLETFDQATNDITHNNDFLSSCHDVMPSCHVIVQPAREARGPKGPARWER